MEVAETAAQAAQRQKSLHHHESWCTVFQALAAQLQGGASTGFQLGRRAKRCHRAQGQAANGRVVGSAPRTVSVGRRAAVGRRRGPAGGRSGARRIHSKREKDIAGSRMHACEMPPILCVVHQRFPCPAFFHFSGDYGRVGGYNRGSQRRLWACGQAYNYVGRGRAAGKLVRAGIGRD